MQGLNVELSYSSSEHHISNYAERSVQVVKGFMKRSAEWPIFLLEYLMTPIRHQGVDSSPLKLMQRRTIRGLLPVKQQESNLDDYVRYHARKQEQAKYQTGKPLQELPEGSNILFYSQRESQWLPGVIVQRLLDRSYVIISERHSVFGKTVAKIIGWRLPSRVSSPHLGNPGSATALDQKVDALFSI